MKKQIVVFIRKLTVNTLATTALSIFLMCIVAAIQKFSLMGIKVPFEILLVNFLAHIGFLLFDLIDMRVRIFNYLVMLVYTLGIIIGFGFLFGWFTVNAIWIVCVVGVAVFGIAVAIDAIKINRDAATINDKLKRLRERKAQERNETE